VEQLKHFKFWCQKVLPLVYDDSLSYYEVLCKVVDYLNNMISDVNNVIDGWEGLKEDLAKIQKWIDEFSTAYIEELIAKYIATMIFVEISDAGYIVYYIPERWVDIQFNTTGLDIVVKEYPEYGRLVLSY
jgi:hypothetical protein